MKKTILLFLLSPFLMLAQNVGINATGATPNSSAMLDIASTDKGVSFPNINLLSETDAVTIPTPMIGLIVYNTNVAMPSGKGLYINSGTPASPIWSALTKTIRNFHGYDNAGRAAVTSTVHTIQPGCSLNIVIPVGQTADIKIDAFLGALGSNTGTNAIMDVVIYLDGFPLALGGWARQVVLANSFGSVTLTSYVSNLAAGAHTIQLRASRSATTGGTTLTLGGDCSLSTNCGEIHAQVFYK